jgi:prepilin-type N-terminal cleavage/methylation domain-containing protein
MFDVGRSSFGFHPMSMTFISFLKSTSGGGKAFTLIEVLVVLIIAAAGISLVAPPLAGTYDKIRMNAEEQRLLSLIQATGMRSFLRQTDVTIELEDNRFGFKDQDMVIEFEHLRFPKAVIRFNGNGFPDTTTITYYASGREKTLDVLQ